MPIKYYENSREFHIFNDEISYIIKIMKNEQLGQIYYGKRLKERESFGHMLEFGYRDMAPCEFDDDITFSLEHLKQEYPAFSSADSRYAAFDLEELNGERCTRFRYDSHRIIKGKPDIDGLPHTYVEDEGEACTLEITLRDEGAGCLLCLSYTIYEKLPVIARNTKIICQSEKPVTLHSAMSISMDLPNDDYDMVYLAGAWGRERYVRERSLDYGIQGIYSMKGSSSHEFNPFLALKEKNASEDCGRVIGFSIIYSGDFLAQAELDNFDVVRVIMGIHPEGFEWELKNGESFQTPEAVMVYSESGLNGMSRTFHKLYKERLVRGEWRDRERPILVNSWEAVHLNFNEEKIMDLAREAAELGAELFVLDDGWFGKRNDVESSLGDWYPNLEKLPHGIAGLSRKIRELGLKFGIWFEPEMANKNSDLYRMHPDWLFCNPNKKNSTGRHQYVLDFSKKEVRDYIFNLMERVLREGEISYVKWDMNRCFSEAFSNGNGRAYQGKARHLYVLGVYELYERLIKRFPHILFESCASGGGRFDAGMLYYAPQGWISDDTDAVERLKIQYGTSMVYPLSSMGSHVSAVPNQQVFRNTPLETRANVAYFGTFGYELDLNALSKEEKEAINGEIKFMKKYRKLLHRGTFYRLQSPFKGSITAWMAVSEDKKEALVGYYRVMQPVNTGFKRLKLRGLREDILYHVDDDEYEYYGDELMECGLIISDFASGVLKKDYDMQGDYMSKIFHLKSV